MVGDSTSLVGDWNWDTTVIIKDECLIGVYELHGPIHDCFSQQLKIRRSGLFWTMSTEGLFEQYQMMDYYMSEISVGKFSFDIELDVKLKYGMYLNSHINGIVSEDSLELDGIPFTGDKGCDKVKNYFTRAK